MRLRPWLISWLGLPLALSFCALSFCALGRIAAGQTSPESKASQTASPSLEELKARGAEISSYRSYQPHSVEVDAPTANLAEFHSDISPILSRACAECHGADTQEGNVRVDTLDPDLFSGDDVNWWLEILAVLSKGEMPPADAAELADEDRKKVTEWLTSEIQIASTVRRSENGHSSFRRMTNYETNYALQDLLGEPFDFTKDLPPESPSEDGFQNSSENLHMSLAQFGTYRDLALDALRKVTVQGEQPPEIYWSVSIQDAAADVWTAQDAELKKISREHKDDPDKLDAELTKKLAEFSSRPNNTHYLNQATGRTERVVWNYGGAKYAWKPSTTQLDAPEISTCVAVIPSRRHLIVELGDTIPDQGTLRVRVRASRAPGIGKDVGKGAGNPSLQLEFGWQASNDSAASVRISERDLEITAESKQPEFYQWEVPLSEIYPRNSVRHISRMGDLPSPSEFIKLVNSSVESHAIQIDYVEVTAPVYEQWPPESHRRIFIESSNRSDEIEYAREVLDNFMTRAWRRSITEAELSQKLALFKNVRPACSSFQEAMTEVLAIVLSSPKFLYLAQAVPRTGDTANGDTATGNITTGDTEPAAFTQTDDAVLAAEELAARLSIFLWCSVPDDELLQLAISGRLRQPDVLASQVERMLADPRSERFCDHFVRQWLGLQLLDYLDVDQDTYPRFDSSLLEAMQQEPAAFFREVLQNNHSVLDFIHADYTMVNERLAKHYGMPRIKGNHFRRAAFQPGQARGGLLTQAGLLAMNSDGKDSHPLKRGIWLLERLLNDPPPPPPAAVPVIDLTDPEIAKMTLKQRIENHRNQAACNSCHAKIDPWGIAFENYDALGGWRTEIQSQPVDATSVLVNGQKMEGMDGLKGFLLENRQDQFVRAIVHKMTTYALGRPLTFSDLSTIEQITADVRNQGDGLATMIRAIVASELFQTK